MRVIVLLAACALAVGLTGCAAPRGATSDARKAWADRMADETLAELREDGQIAAILDDEAVAMGVFEVISVNALIFSTTGGYGVIIDQESDRRTYVEINGGGPGLGAGFTRGRSVYVLRSRDIADAFHEGALSWNGEAELAWRPKGCGFSVDAAGATRKEVSVYHEVQHGISAGVSVQAVGVYP